MTSPDEKSSDQPASGKPPAGNPSAAESSVGKAPDSKPPLSKSPVGKSPDGKPPVSKPSPDKPPHKKRRRLKFAAVALIVVLAGVGAWQAWLGFKPMMQQVVEFFGGQVERDAGQSAEQDAGQSPGQDIEQPPPTVTMRDVVHRLDATERRLEEVAAERSAETPAELREHWRLFEAERYLTEAGERLQTGADVRFALTALKAAKRALENAGFEADAARRALDVEIERLSGYRNQAALQALAGIDELLRELERGVETAPDEESAPDSAMQRAAAGDDGWWSSLIAAVSARVERLVVVEKKEKFAPGRFTAGVVMQSLLLARTAALAGDGTSYRYAIANAMQAFEHGGEAGAATDDLTHDPLYNPVYKKLQVLYPLDVAGEPPHVGAALDEVRAITQEVKP